MEQVDETTAREALVEMLPDPPDVPTLPALHWRYQDGLYGLSEEDADRFLDFKENVLQAFKIEIDAWVDEVLVIMQQLI